MSEPLRTDPALAPDPSGAVNRAARIEQLLLSGLDFYFAGQYDQAINVWTRVVFLERGHGRARAYIERARSAMAERQRESEELLHKGVAAYNEGDVKAARDLLTRAVEEGDGTDEALVFLQRLNRVTAAASLRETATQTSSLPTGAHEELARRRRPWLMPLLISAAIVGGGALGAAPLVSWLTDLPGAGTTPAPLAVAAEPLPVVRTAEVVLARARDLQAGGHLQDALRMLERIDVGDPLRAEANRIRADIQRSLLATASLRPAAPPEAEASR